MCRRERGLMRAGSAAPRSGRAVGRSPGRSPGSPRQRGAGGGAAAAGHRGVSRPLRSAPPAGSGRAHRRQRSAAGRSAAGLFQLITGKGVPPPRRAGPSSSAGGRARRGRGRRPEPRGCPAAAATSAGAGGAARVRSARRLRPPPPRAERGRGRRDAGAAGEAALGGGTRGSPAPLRGAPPQPSARLLLSREAVPAQLLTHPEGLTRNTHLCV